MTKFPHIMPISLIMSQMANQAREHGARMPVIETDFESAKILQAALAEAIGCYLRDISPLTKEQIPGGVLWTMVEYDGVKIVVRHVDPCQPPVDDWREHFGPLADIWSK